MILNSGKDIENRDWPTRFRGRFLIHASKGMTHDEYDRANDPIWYRGGPTINLPPPADLERGGIVGEADLIDCVTASSSFWFNGTFGFVLANVKRLPFRPYRGALGFFEVEP